MGGYYTDLNLCVARLGSGRFGVGFWMGLRAWDFPTERVLSRTPLIIRTVDQYSWLLPLTVVRPVFHEIHRTSNVPFGS